MTKKTLSKRQQSWDSVCKNSKTKTGMKLDSILNSASLSPENWLLFKPAAEEPKCLGGWAVLPIAINILWFTLKSKQQQEVRWLENLHCKLQRTLFHSVEWTTEVGKKGTYHFTKVLPLTKALCADKMEDKTKVATLGKMCWFPSAVKAWHANK